MKELKKQSHNLSMTVKQLSVDCMIWIRATGHDDRLERIERLARLEAIETELAEKRETLTNAKLIPSKRARMKVAIGSIVDLIDQEGRLVQYTIVDTIEANPSDDAFLHSVHL